MIKPYKDGKMIIKTLIISIFVLSIMGYGLFQAKKIIEGPEISVASPLNGGTVSSSAVDIEGVAKNIASISLNDRPIFIDESGNFKEKLMLYPGYNIITIKAHDKFGSAIEKKVELVYKI